MIHGTLLELAFADVRLREVGPGDVRSLYEWRRQPRTREMFYSEGPESWDEHCRFFSAYFEPSNVDAWFVIEEAGLPVGALALYRNANFEHPWEAGRIVLQPGERGLRAFRLARTAIALLMDYARSCGHPEMRCEVLEHNRVMQAIVSSLGFEVKRSGAHGGQRFLEMAVDLGSGRAAAGAPALLATAICDTVVARRRTAPRSARWRGHREEFELSFREVELEDAKWLHTVRSDPATRDCFLDSREIPFPEHEAFVTRYVTGRARDRWFVIQESGRPIGTIALYSFSSDGAEAEWGRFVIVPERRGRGLGRRALELLISHARGMGVRRLRCWCLGDNEPALHLYQELGFRESGAVLEGSRHGVELVMDLEREA